MLTVHTEFIEQLESITIIWVCDRYLILVSRLLQDLFHIIVRANNPEIPILLLEPALNIQT